MADTATTTPASHDDVRWLDADELLMWRSFIDAASTVLGSVEADMKRDTDGLTFDDYEVLVHLSESPEHRLRMAELSERLLHSRSRLTQRVDRMVDRGLLAREKCPDDKRGTFAVLTPLGLSTIEAAAPDHLVAVRAAFVDLIDPADRPAVTRALMALRRRQDDGTGTDADQDAEGGAA